MTAASTRTPSAWNEEVSNHTLDEALACRKAGVTVTTFMVAQGPLLVSFVEELTRLNRGRAYLTAPDGLGATLVIDFIHNRRTPL